VTRWWYRSDLAAPSPHLVLDLHAEQHRRLHVLEGHVEGVALRVDLVAVGGAEGRGAGGRQAERGADNNMVVKAAS
jgi:hypothetical protein